jgi:hypothetical protein
MLPARLLNRFDEDLVVVLSTTRFTDGIRDRQVDHHDLTLMDENIDRDSPLASGQHRCQPHLKFFLLGGHLVIPAKHPYSIGVGAAPTYVRLL